MTPRCLYFSTMAIFIILVVVDGRRGGGFGRSRSTFRRVSTPRKSYASNYRRLSYNSPGALPRGTGYQRGFLHVGGGFIGGYMTARLFYGHGGLFSPRYPHSSWYNNDRYYYDPRRDRFFDADENRTIEEAPCEKPAYELVPLDDNESSPPSNDTIEWQKYAECLEYYSLVRSNYGPGGIYNGVALAAANKCIIAIFLLLFAIGFR